MLYYLAEKYESLTYLKSIYLRGFLGFAISLMIVMILGKPFIAYLRKEKIGDEAKLDARSIVEVAPKQVTFSQNTPSVGMPGFLNKLKKKPDDLATKHKKPDDHTSPRKKPDDHTSLHEKLDRILTGQDEILSLLRKSERRNAETMDSYQRPTYTLQEPDDGRPTYASQGSDDGRREYNDDRNWNGGHLTPGS